MVRIKYSEVGDLVYTDWYTVGPNFIVRGIINIKTFTFQVIEFNTDTVSEGQGNNLRHTKNMLKNTLSNVGVNFTGEIRKR